MATPSVLIVDDEQEMCSSLEELFRDEGFAAFSTTDPMLSFEFLDSQTVDLVLMDIRMPGMGGIDLLGAVKDRHPDLPVIMITGYPSVETAVRAMKYGAVNYYSKPLDLSKLLAEARRLLAETENRLPPPPNGDGLIGRHPSLERVREMILRAGEVDAPVLITGESGTGKELVAEAIHSASSRRSRDFVRVNCAAIPESLIESELFGNEAGAFTDAKRRRAGRFEAADRGTLFLDEIGDMSLATQAKILRALQEQTFERVGGVKPVRTDTRFIAATHRDLRAMIEDGSFREDLYYRLAVITVHIPALRTRGGDIDLLVDHFLDYFGAKYDKRVAEVDPRVRSFFRHHQWPGNVRELRNCVERAVIFANSGRIGFEHLPAQYEHVIEMRVDSQPETKLEQVNKEIIRDALSKSDGVKSRAAELLSISRKTLYNRMKRLGME